MVIEQDSSSDSRGYGLQLKKLLWIKSDTNLRLFPPIKRLEWQLLPWIPKLPLFSHYVCRPAGQVSGSSFMGNLFLVIPSLVREFEWWGHNRFISKLQVITSLPCDYIFVPQNILHTGHECGWITSNKCLWFWFYYFGPQVEYKMNNR